MIKLKQVDSIGGMPLSKLKDLRERESEKVDSLVDSLKKTREEGL